MLAASRLPIDEIVPLDGVNVTVPFPQFCAKQNHGATKLDVSDTATAESSENTRNAPSSLCCVAYVIEPDSSFTVPRPAQLLEVTVSELVDVVVVDVDVAELEVEEDAIWLFSDLIDWLMSVMLLSLSRIA